MAVVTSGAGTNLKVGGTSPEQKGAPIRRKRRKKNFLVVPLHFLALKAQLVVLVFRDGSVQFGQFIVCCSTSHGSSRAKPFVKVGGHVPPPRPAPWSRRHWW